MLDKQKAKLKIALDEMQYLNEELIKTKSKLEILNRELIQNHQAMSVLARNINSKKMELEKNVNTTISSKVMPIIVRLLNEKMAEKFWPELGLISEYLNSITTKNELHLKSIGVLSETEMKIAAMVKNKMTSKDIAKLMCISTETVRTHRKNIRRKLNIHNTKYRLSEYLMMVLDNE